MEIGVWRTCPFGPFHVIITNQSVANLSQASEGFCAFETFTNVPWLKEMIAYPF